MSIARNVVFVDAPVPAKAPHHDPVPAGDAGGDAHRRDEQHQHREPSPCQQDGQARLAGQRPQALPMDNIPQTDIEASPVLAKIAVAHRVSQGNSGGVSL